MMSKCVLLLALIQLFATPGQAQQDPSYGGDVDYHPFADGAPQMNTNFRCSATSGANAAQRNDVKQNRVTIEVSGLAPHSSVGMVVGKNRDGPEKKAPEPSRWRFAPKQKLQCGMGIDIPFTYDNQSEEMWKTADEDGVAIFRHFVKHCDQFTYVVAGVTPEAADECGNKRGNGQTKWECADLCSTAVVMETAPSGFEIRFALENYGFDSKINLGGAFGELLSSEGEGFDSIDTAHLDDLLLDPDATIEEIEGSFELSRIWVMYFAQMLMMDLDMHNNKDFQGVNMMYFLDVDHGKGHGGPHPRHGGGVPELHDLFNGPDPALTGWNHYDKKLGRYSWRDGLPESGTGTNDDDKFTFGTTGHNNGRARVNGNQIFEQQYYPQNERKSLYVKLFIDWGYGIDEASDAEKEYREIYYDKLTRNILDGFQYTGRNMNGELKENSNLRQFMEKIGMKSKHVVLTYLGKTFGYTAEPEPETIACTECPATECNSGICNSANKIAR